MTPANTRQEALASNNQFYRMTVPCGRGHLAKRYTLSANCVECQHEQHRTRRKKQQENPSPLAYLKHAHQNIRNRCCYPSHPKYPDYGGRGITMCGRWRGKGGFARFCEDMGERPSPRHSIDRIRVNEGYHPGNCRWADPSTQRKNQRTRKGIERFSCVEIIDHVKSWSKEDKAAMMAALLS